VKLNGGADFSNEDSIGREKKKLKMSGLICHLLGILNQKFKTKQNLSEIWDILEM